MPTRNYPNVRQIAQEILSEATGLSKGAMATLTELSGVSLCGADKAFPCSYAHDQSPRWSLLLIDGWFEKKVRSVRQEEKRKANR